MRRLDIWAVAVFALGCDDSEPSRGGEWWPPRPDAGPCAEAYCPWSLQRSEDGASFSFHLRGLPVFESLRVGLEVGGEVTWGAVWPEVSWLAHPGWEQVRFYGHPRLPDLELGLSVTEWPRVTAGIVPFEEVTVDAFHLEGRVALAGLEPSLPTTSAGFFQGFSGPGGAVLARVMGGDLSRIEWRETGGGLTLAVRWPLGHALTERRWLDTLQLAAGDDPLALADAVAASYAEVREVGFGWRTGPAYGPALTFEAIEREIDTLRGLARARGVEAAPALLVEGAWFAALGDWQGLAPRLADLTDVEVGLVWPAAYGPGQPPEILDLSLPAHQDIVTRAALLLAAWGVDWLVITEVPEGTDVEGLRRALLRRWPPVLTDQPHLAPHFEGLSLAGALPDPEGCWPAVLAGTGACVARDAPLQRPAAPLADSQDALESWAHLAHRFSVDPGGVRLGGSPGEARISAVLNAATGGPYLLADAPSQLSAEQADLYFQVFSLNLNGLRPRYPLDGGRATWWESADAIVLINWGDTPATRTLPDRRALDGIARRLTAGEPYASGAEVSIPPRDLVLFRR